MESKKGMASKGRQMLKYEGNMNSTESVISAFQSDLVRKANANQLEAIQQTDGPLLIVAGPGTGKTFTLINRTMNLIVEKGVDPSKIMVCTFTEKAAKELKTRLSSEAAKYNVKINPQEMLVGTFHSICLKLIKDNLAFSSLSKNFRLMDQFDQQYFIYRHFSEFQKVKDFDNFIDKKTYWEKCAQIMGDLNRLEEELIDSKQLLGSSNKTNRFYGELLSVYKDLKAKHNLLDFSSIQTEVNRMLVNNPEFKEKILGQIEYVMVDEYQDTNHVQESLTLLFGLNRNICVVGDDDQALYRFRGATVRNILEFPKHFPDCHIVHLDQNYRSTGKIVDFYNKWMNSTDGDNFEFDWGKYRYPKRIIAANPREHLNDSVIKIESNKEASLKSNILDFIKKLISSGKVTDLNQIAFLFRSVKTKAASDLSDFLEKNGIPVYSPRSNRFFQRDEIRLLIGLLLLLFPKYVGQLSISQKEGKLYPNEQYLVECIQFCTQDLKQYKRIDLLEWVKVKAKKHINLVGTLNYSFSTLVYEALEFEPFKSFVDVDLSLGVRDTRSARNIASFLNLIVKFEAINGLIVFSDKNMDKVVKLLFGTYFRFLLDGGLGEYEDESEYAPSGCVSFLTIHQSKGMEFPIVIVGSQSATPRKQYDENMEAIIEKFSGRGSFEPLEAIKYFDFWRLFYVAFSRALDLLVLACDTAKKNEPSSYFKSLYEGINSEIDLSKYEFSSIKDVFFTPSYSFTSDINVYLTCPTQYKFFNELGFEPIRTGGTLFGTVVHETIEDINKKAIEGNSAAITEDNVSSWLDLNYHTASKATNSYLSPRQIETAKKHVLNYVKRVGGDWSSIKDTEMPISLNIEDFVIDGKVDLIMGSNGKYQILDFKTEKKPDMTDSVKMTRVKRQLEIYTYLFEQRYGIKIDGMKAFYTGETDGNPYVSFRKDDSDIKNTIETFKEVVGAIRRKKFSEKCTDGKICRDCDFRFFCGRK